MQRRGELDEGGEEILVVSFGRLPEIFPDLVRFEIRTAVERGDGVFERVSHRLSESSIHGGVASILSARYGCRSASFSFISQATRRYEKCPFTPDRRREMYSTSA